MRNIIRAGVFVFVFAFMIGCNEDELPDENILKIEIGTECGWCAGQEYLTITSSKILYTRNIPCGDEKGTTNKNRNITASEWDEIIGLFDYDFFLTLNHNECNVCADGCDELLKVTKDETVHELRYSPSIQIEGMDNLRARLQLIMNEFRN